MLASAEIASAFTDEAQYRVTSLNTCATCLHSSPVGTSTSPTTPPPPPASLLSSTLFTIGSTNAAVLPDPVGARASTSFPASDSAIPCACTGVGLPHFSLVSARRTRVSSPSSDHVGPAGATTFCSPDSAASDAFIDSIDAAG